MHSSRMHTGDALTVSRGGWDTTPKHGIPPPPCEQNESQTRVKITLP